MLGPINPVIIFAIVDLPEPDSPTNLSVSPSNNSKDTLSTALTILSFDGYTQNSAWQTPSYSKLLVNIFTHSSSLLCSQ